MYGTASDHDYQSLRFLFCEEMAFHFHPRFFGESHVFQPFMSANSMIAMFVASSRVPIFCSFW
jgi:hypothetical protein